MSSTHCRFDRSSCENRRKFSMDSAAWLASAWSSCFSSESILFLSRSKQSAPSASPSLAAIATVIATADLAAAPKVVPSSTGNSRTPISPCVSRALCTNQLPILWSSGGLPPGAVYTSVSRPRKTVTPPQLAFSMRVARPANRCKNSGRCRDCAASTASSINSSARRTAGREDSALARRCVTRREAIVFGPRI